MSACTQVFCFSDEERRQKRICAIHIPAGHLRWIKCIFLVSFLKHRIYIINEEAILTGILPYIMLPKKGEFWLVFIAPNDATRSEDYFSSVANGRETKMKNKQFLRIAVVLVLVVTLTMLIGTLSYPQMASAQSAIIDLGTRGRPQSHALAINNPGRVIGITGYNNAFSWRAGTMSDLSLPDGAISAIAYGINNRGQMVGLAYMSSGPSRCILWQGDQVKVLASPSNRNIACIAINDAEQIVGDMETANGSLHAFRWEAGNITDLGEGEYSAALAINNRGQIVGMSYVGMYIHAFLWYEGTMTDLGTLPNGRSSIARSINERGQIVGEIRVPEPGFEDPVPHAVWWDNGTITDLGARSWANGINNVGQIVGTSFFESSGQSHAFLWENGRMVDLGTLPGATGSTAVAINDNGQVVGSSATSSGPWHAVLWKK